MSPPALPEPEPEHLLVADPDAGRVAASSHRRAYSESRGRGCRSDVVEHRREAVANPTNATSGAISTLTNRVTLVFSSRTPEKTAT